LSGSDSEVSEDDGTSRKETTLSSLLKKQAYVSGNIVDGSDDFESKKKNRGPGKLPLLWFSTSTLPSNIYLGIYRAIFSNLEKDNESSIIDIIRKKQLAPKPAPKTAKEDAPLPEEYKGPHLFMCMIGGGHFAAMVVALAPKYAKSSAPGPLAREATVLAHKTFHRYTTRRKQGGSQSTNDSAKGAAHSAGAGIRRYNEAALIDDVRKLLSDWKSMIETSELIFVRATGTANRRTLYGPYEGQVLRQEDPRIRGFPFNTRRATQNELMRSFIELTRVKVQELDEPAICVATAAELESTRAAALTKQSKISTPAVPEISAEDETALLHTSQIQALVRRSKLPALLSYFKSNSLAPDFLFFPKNSQQHHHAPTPLHLAASLNSPAVITGLLVKAGASPLVKNGDGKPPFELAGDRATRDAFRGARYVLGEKSFDWDAAHVPSALAPVDVEQRLFREKQEKKMKEEERRKVESERLNAEGPKIHESGPLGKAAGRGRALALGAAQKTAQEKREEETKGMTPEMKMRFERERRARAAEERMKKMAGGG
jgi:hypothetical protein